MPGLRTKQLPLGLYVEWIDTDGQPYLVRTHLTPWKHWPFPFRVYLHKFYRPDADRVFHDHPWSFFTFVLKGGYDELSHDRSGPPEPTANGMEASPTGRLIPDTLRRFSWRSRPPQHAHRITRLHTPTVITLIFRSSRRGRDWGFWCPPANYVDDSGGEVLVSRVNNPSNFWRWVYWRDYLDVQDPNQGEAY